MPSSKPYQRSLKKKCPLISPASSAWVSRIFALISECPVRHISGLPPASRICSFRWLVHFTSLIGTVAYVVAAVRLQSRLVVYLSIAFLLSTAWSSVAVLGAALAWYFAALVVFSALLSLVG